MRYKQLTEKLICGAVPESDQDIPLLESLGVQAVINCVEEPANQRSKWKGLQCYIPQIDDGSVRSPEVLAKGIEFFNTSSCVVYVHCWEGKRRGPTMAYAILRANGMSQDEAYTLISPPPEYVKSVENFLAGKK